MTTDSTLRLDHLALPCFAPAETVRFYTQVLGLPLHDAFSGDDWDGRPWLMMLFALPDGRQLAFCALAGVQPPPSGDLPQDLRHYAFSVTSHEALESWRRRLRGHAVGFREEDHGTQRSIYFMDPNRVTLEITAPSSEATSERNAGAIDVVQQWLRTAGAPRPGSRCDT